MASRAVALGLILAFGAALPAMAAPYDQGPPGDHGRDGGDRGHGPGDHGPGRPGDHGPGDHGRRGPGDHGPDGRDYGRRDRGREDRGPGWQPPYVQRGYYAPPPVYYNQPGLSVFIPFH